MLLSVLLTPVFPVPATYLAHLGCSRSMRRIKIEPYTWELLGWCDSLQCSPDLLHNGSAGGESRMQLWDCHYVHLDSTYFILISPSPILALPQHSELAPSLSNVLYWSQLGRNSEKAMAPHSSTFAWKILWMEEPGRLQSMGSLRVRYDWATSISLFTFMHWRRKWQPIPVFLPGESRRQGSLVGCRLCGRTESDTTEAT